MEKDCILIYTIIGSGQMALLSLYTHLKLPVAMIYKSEDKCIYYFELT
jgi:hypothetical protein